MITVKAKKVRGRERLPRTPLFLGLEHWHYVYELVDPRDGKTFYVGCGRHQRMYEHDRQAELGLLTRKCGRIRDIWAAGLVIERRVIGLFRERRPAYKFELKRIHELGYENLTNSRPGVAHIL